MPRDRPRQYRRRSHRRHPNVRSTRRPGAFALSAPRSCGALEAHDSDGGGSFGSSRTPSAAPRRPVVRQAPRPHQRRASSRTQPVPRAAPRRTVRARPVRIEAGAAEYGTVGATVALPQDRRAFAVPSDTERERTEAGHHATNVDRLTEPGRRHLGQHVDPFDEIDVAEEMAEHSLGTAGHGGAHGPICEGQRVEQGTGIGGGSGMRSHRALGRRATRSDGRVDRGRAWQAGRRPRRAPTMRPDAAPSTQAPKGHDGSVGAESVTVGGGEDRLRPRSASSCMPARSSHQAASPAAIGSSSPTASTRCPALGARRRTDRRRAHRPSWRRR